MHRKSRVFPKWHQATLHRFHFPSSGKEWLGTRRRWVFLNYLNWNLKYNIVATSNPNIQTSVYLPLWNSYRIKRLMSVEGAKDPSWFIKLTVVLARAILLLLNLGRILYLTKSKKIYSTLQAVTFPIMYQMEAEESLEVSEVQCLVHWAPKAVCILVYVTISFSRLSVLALLCFSQLC